MWPVCDGSTLASGYIDTGYFTYYGSSMLQPVVFVLLFAFIIQNPVFSGTGEVIILDYHTFIGNRKSSMDFTKDELVQQLERFEKLGFHFVSLEDAIQGRVSGSKNLVFTIDDGNHSVPAIVSEVLFPRGIIPTMFISSALTARSQFCFRPDMLKNLYEKGCIIGAHGYTHQFLTHKAFQAELARSRDEIVKPGPMITQWLGTAPVYFAYPFGVTSPEAKALLHQSGYRYAFLADAAVHPVRLDDPGLDPYEIPRTIMYRWSVKKVMAELSKIDGIVAQR